MSSFSKHVLFWAPRGICLLFIAFVSMFALDVFGEGRGLWGTIVALTMQLLPSLVMAAALAIAWRWEWVGAVVFTGAALFFAEIVRGTWGVKAIFAIPCLITAALFLANWLRRAELRTR
jgi:hypothetical protein